MERSLVKLAYISHGIRWFALFLIGWESEWHDAGVINSAKCRYLQKKKSNVLQRSLTKTPWHCLGSISKKAKKLKFHSPWEKFVFKTGKLILSRLIRCANTKCKNICRTHWTQRTWPPPQGISLAEWFKVLTWCQAWGASCLSHTVCETEGEVLSI